MRSQKILNAIGRIDDELILEAMTIHSERVNTKPVRWIKFGALAACLCLLLALPIVATQSDLLVDIFSDMTGWRVRAKGYYSDKDFSKEVRALSQELAGDTKYAPMESLEQVEEFLGVAIPDNSLLTEEIADEVHIEVEENGQRIRYDTPCLIYLAFSEDGSTIAVDTTAAYRYEQMHLYVTYRMPTEYATAIDGGGFGSQQANIVGSQTYITPSGRECAVFYTSTGDGVFSGYGYTVVDAVLVELSLVGKSEAEIRKVITEVLDGFA